MADKQKIEAPVMAISRHRLRVDGEGVTTLVLLAGCPLHCRYCLNDYCHELREWPIHTAESLLAATRLDDLYFQATGGGITFGGGEPLLHSPFIEAFYHTMRAEIQGQPWRICIESSLQASEAHLRRLMPIVEEWIVDVKDTNPDIYLRYTDLAVDRLMTNLRILAEAGLQDRVTLRIPAIPDYNTDADRDRSEVLLREMGFTRFDRFDYIIREK